MSPQEQQELNRIKQAIAHQIKEQKKKLPISDRKTNEGGDFWEVRTGNNKVIVPITSYQINGNSRLS